MAAFRLFASDVEFLVPLLGVMLLAAAAAVVGLAGRRDHVSVDVAHAGTHTLAVQLLDMSIEPPRVTVPSGTHLTFK